MPPTLTLKAYEYKHALLSYIGRINYNYDEQVSYFGNSTPRRQLPLDQKYPLGNLPFCLCGLALRQRSFFPFNPDVVNMFKVRASYGELGNENIGEYMYQAVMSRNNMTYSFGNGTSDRFCRFHFRGQ